MSVQRYLRLPSGKRKATPEYKTWDSMKQRCLNPRHKSYPAYGGRGIFICSEWLTSFDQFMADMGMRPGNSYSVERIDVDGPYSPFNCRWATNREQARNKRNTAYVVLHGARRKISELAEELGVRNSFIHKRLAAGCSIERAVILQRIFTPTGKKGSLHRDAKLTEDGVRDIRRRASEGVMLKHLAAEYGVKQNTVSMIVSRRKWKHVE